MNQKREGSFCQEFTKTKRMRRGGGGTHSHAHGTGRGRGNWHSRGRSRDRGHQLYNRPKALHEHMSGFLCTCNMNQKECVKEAFNILNEYVRDEDTAVVTSVVKDTVSDSASMKELKLTDGMDSVAEANVTDERQEDSATDASVSQKQNKEDADEDDIEAALKAEVAELKNSSTRTKFFNVDTGVPNLVFIKSTVTNPAALAHRILEDITTNKVQKSRFLLRLIPIEFTCMAHMDQIEATCRLMLPKYFAGDFTSFQVLYKSRYNSNIDRSEVIRLIAELVHEINPLNVVDLSNPKYSIIVEVLKNVVCLSVVTDFHKFKKYNLIEASGLGEIEKNSTVQKPTNSAAPSSTLNNPHKKIDTTNSISEVSEPVPTESIKTQDLGERSS